MPPRRPVTGIKNLPDGRFQVDIATKDGKRPRHIYDSRKEAKRALDILRGQNEEDRLPKKKENITFSEIVDRLLEYQKGRVADRTFMMQQGLLGIFKNETQLGPLRIQEIDQDQVVKALHAISKRQVAGKDIKGSTLNQYRVALSSVFTFAIDIKEIIMRHPVKRVEPFLEDDLRERQLTEEEEIAVREVMTKFFPEKIAEFEIALYTGMRREEQFELLWKDVDLKRYLLTIRDEISKSRTHWVPLHPACVEAFDKLRVRSKGSPRVTQHGSYNTFTRWFDGSKPRAFTVLKAAQIEDFHWHDLRHTFASRCVMAGIPLPRVSSWLGHQDIDTTMRYAHLADGHGYEEIEKMLGVAAGAETNDKTNDIFGSNLIHLIDSKRVTKSG